jgi:hypothetical protein
MHPVFKPTPHGLRFVHWDCQGADQRRLKQPPPMHLAMISLKHVEGSQGRDKREPFPAQWPGAAGWDVIRADTQPCRPPSVDSAASGRDCSLRG